MMVELSATESWGAALLAQIEQSPQLSALLDVAPAIFHVMFGVGIVVGLALWLLGRKLARPGCALSGLILAGMAAMYLARHWANPVWLLALIIGAALVGCVMAFLLFRIWMGLSCGLILALAVPAANLAWTGTPAPDIPQDAFELQIDEPERIDDSEDEADVEDAQDAEDEQPLDQKIQEHVRQVLQQQVNALTAWWDDLGSSGQRTTIIATGIGGIIGLLVGLIFPYIAASVQSGLVGSLLMIFCSVQLIRMHTAAPPGWLPEQLRTQVIVISLITLVGVALQWTLFRPKADS